MRRVEPQTTAGCGVRAGVLHCMGVAVEDNSETPGRSWRGWREALSVVMWPANLKRTVVTALVVGTILFAINQLNVVVDGDATPTSRSGSRPR